jgi:hypothetical protein
MLTNILFVATGLLVYRSAGFFSRIFSDAADRWERDGVVRNGGGYFGKIWKEDSPRRFESRVEGVRFSAAFTRLLLKGCGAIFVIGGIGQIIGSVVR